MNNLDQLINFYTNKCNSLKKVIDHLNACNPMHSTCYIEMEKEIQKGEFEMAFKTVNLLEEVKKTNNNQPRKISGKDLIQVINANVESEIRDTNTYGPEF